MSKGKGPDNAVHLYGISPVMQCLLHNSRKCQTLYVKEKGSARIGEVEELARKRNLPVRRVDAHRLGLLAGTKRHQGVVLACGELKINTLDDFLRSGTELPKKLLVALDRLEDPQNVGAIVRTAAFLGASGLITVGKRVPPLGSTVSKASAGALEHFPIFQAPNLAECLAKLKREAFSIVGSSSDGSTDFRATPITDYMVLVLGNEGQGLRRLTQDRCDHIVRIPGARSFDSLNVGAACAILLQHLAQRIFQPRPAGSEMEKLQKIDATICR